jgi:hypothetical protein
LELFAAFLLFILIGMMIMGMVFYRQAKKVNKDRSYVLPDLGMHVHNETYEVAMKHMLKHLTNSYPSNYPDWVQERVIREHYLHLIEYENRWFEWQRFLIMTALLKGVPMYSEEVDIIWHEMLMFTREYEEFSQRYLKTTLHHIPNVPRDPQQKNESREEKEEISQEKRAWFDLIYVLLFEPTPYSVTVLRPFFLYPLSQTVISDFQTLSVTALEDKYFHAKRVKQFAFMQEIVQTLITKIQEMLEMLKKHVDVHGTDMKRFLLNPTAQAKTAPAWENQLLAWLFLSMYHRDNFAEQAKKWRKYKKLS